MVSKQPGSAAMATRRSASRARMGRSSQAVVDADASEGPAVDAGTARVGEAGAEPLDAGLELPRLVAAEGEVGAEAALETAAVADAVAHPEERAEFVLGHGRHRLLVLVHQPEAGIRA